MQCRFPLAEVDGITIAVLLCETNEEHLGLLLHPAKETELRDPTHNVYYTGWAFETGDTHRYCRVARLGNDLYNLRFRGKTFKAEWRDIIIHAGLRPEDRAGTAELLSRFPADGAAGLPFRIPRWTIGTLFSLHLVPDCTVAERKDNGQQQIMLQCADSLRGESARICMGVCTDSDASPLDVGRTFHWARAEPAVHANRRNDAWHMGVHDCRADHVDAWPGGAKTFGNDERTIRLSFAPCKYSPKTRVVHIELLGSVYEQLLREAGLRMPGRAELDREIASRTALTAQVDTRPRGGSLRGRFASMRSRRGLPQRNEEASENGEASSENALVLERDGSSWEKVIELLRRSLSHRTSLSALRRSE